MAKVTMPQLGESVAEGTIGRWLKKPGDSVAKYEPLLEVITDKVNAEVPSPVAGILKEILVEEGATVPNNAEIAVIEEAGEAVSAGEAPTAFEKQAAASEANGRGAHVEPASAQPASISAPAHGPAGSDERPAPEPIRPAATATAAPPPSVAPDRGLPPGDPDARMTPAVRRLLREHALEPGQIVGTGGGGRITREDVLNFVEAVRTGTKVGAQQPAGAAASAPAATAAPAKPGSSGPAAATEAPAAASATAAPASAAAPSAAAAAAAPAAHVAAAAAPGTRVEFPDGVDELLLPMTQMRKGIAAQMTRSLQVPHAWVQMEVDATNLVRLREAEKRNYQAREGLSLSFVPFVVKAATEALKRLPEFNAHWTEQGILAKRHVNVGVAVAVEDGLIVPVVRDVDKLSINGLNHAIADVSARARASRLRLDDFGGGTFTVDNTGWLGSNMTIPIINVPEVAILTMEQIRKRAVVVETADGDVIAIRPIMNMVLGIDHRANDGAGGAAFLRIVKDWLESVGPETTIY